MKTFAEFWPYYVRAHSQPLTRVMHAIGSTLALVCIALGITVSRLVLPGRAGHRLRVRLDQPLLHRAQQARHVRPPVLVAGRRLRDALEDGHRHDGPRGRQARHG